MEALSAVEEIVLDTPFGAPSDAYVVGTLGGQRVAFLARHGRGHRFSPHRVNYRPDLYGFKMLGVEYLIGVSACRQPARDLAPGHIVIPNQLFDRTQGRKLSFFDDPEAGTQGLVRPCRGRGSLLQPALGDLLRSSQTDRGCSALGEICSRSRGRCFSTKAESRTFRSWGMDLIGMTTTPEAQLAREAEMSYAVMAHVTDYDVWHESETPVTVEKVDPDVAHRMRRLPKQAVINAAARRGRPLLAAGRLAASTIITNRSAVRREVIERLALLVGHYFG
jgi:5'-methylthioadenosine phosphorylase